MILALWDWNDTYFLVAGVAAFFGLLRCIR